MSSNLSDSACVLVLLLPGLFVGIAFVISCCGWRQLAGRYRATAQPPAGCRYHGVSGWMAPFILGSYHNCLNVTVSPAGIHVVPWIPFRLFHPPLLFPWACVEQIDTRSGWLRGRTEVRLAPSDLLEFHLCLPKRAAGQVLGHCPASANTIV